jgi:hypothetical protein
VLHRSGAEGRKHTHCAVPRAEVHGADRAAACLA